MLMCYQVWFVLLLRRLNVDIWWPFRELNMKLVIQSITSAKRTSCWMDQIKWLVYLMGHGVQSLPARVNKALDKTMHQVIMTVLKIHIKNVICININIRFGMFWFPDVNHKPPFLFVMTNSIILFAISSLVLPISPLSSPSSTQQGDRGRSKALAVWSDGWRGCSRRECDVFL